MGKKKKSTQEINEIAREDAEKQYGISLKDLETLMQARGIEELQDIHGGVGGLGQKLKTNLITGKLKKDQTFLNNWFYFLGLSEDQTDLSTRIAAFGRNEIPPKPPKTFFRLMFEALQDITLVILITCAVVSFALSIYHPGEVSFEEELRPSKKINFLFNQIIWFDIL